MPIPPAEIDLSRFHQVFLDEAAELLQVIESGLLRIDRNKADSELFHAIFRAAHSIKGNAGMTGWQTVESFTHVVEGILDQLRSGTREPDAELIRVMLRATDALKTMLSAGPLEPMSPEAEQCIRLLSDAPLPAAPTPIASQENKLRDYQIRWTPPKDCLCRGVDPLRVLASLADLGTILKSECRLDSLPELRSVDPQESYLSWTLDYRSAAPIEAIEEIFSFQALEADLTIDDKQEQPAKYPPTLDPGEQQRPPTGPATVQSDTIRVAATKLDSIFDLVGEMVIAHSMAMQAIATEQHRLPELHNILDELGRQTRLLQEHIMSLRLVPVEQVFRRLPRMIHDLSHQLGKTIDLDLQGAETEIDRAVVEQLNDPLLHLLRNCADHGIENADERIEQGKRPVGTIRVTARCQGGSTIVEVQDDGRGLNTERIRKKALHLGLIDPQTPMTEKQIHSLIFHPGFSTSETVTSISGRGVGMDAVRSSIERASGSITIQSKHGQGSKFTLHLPMNMAILDGLLVKTADTVLVIPMVSVIECLRPAKNQIRPIHRTPGVTPKAAPRTSAWKTALPFHSCNHAEPPAAAQ
jgi:two-component system, chemotaxis family, sensor kinase CheA